MQHPEAIRAQQLHTNLGESVLIPYSPAMSTALWECYKKAGQKAENARKLRDASEQLLEEMKEYVQNRCKGTQVVFASNAGRLRENYFIGNPDYVLQDLGNLEAALILEADSEAPLKRRTFGLSGEALILNFLQLLFTTNHFQFQRGIKKEANLLGCTIKPDFATSFTMPGQPGALFSPTKVMGEIKVLAKSWEVAEFNRIHHIEQPTYLQTLQREKILNREGNIDLKQIHPYTLQTLLYAACTKSDFADLALCVPQGLFVVRIPVTPQLCAMAMERYWNARVVMSDPHSLGLWRKRQTYSRMSDLLQTIKVELIPGAERPLMVRAMTQNSGFDEEDIRFEFESTEEENSIYEDNV